MAANGATATASSSYPGFAPSGVINGDRKGLFVWQDGYWSTSSAGAGWLEVQFNGSRTITEVDVITLQDNYQAPVEPTEAMTFSAYGLTTFEVQYWTGSAWATLSGAVAGNNKVWRKFTFAAITTTKIRVLANGAPDGFGRLAEVEAWTGPSPTPRYNLALGATATASSSASAGYGPGGVVNGDRKSLNWGNGGGWADAAPVKSFPDWLQVDFGASKTIGEVDVFTLQDSYAAPVEPTESTTFSQWGVTAYEVQYWDGSTWLTVTGGNISDNNRTWRRFTFAPVSTTKIRVYTHAAADGYSRLTEIEAYEPDSSNCGTNPRLDPLNATGGGSENPLSRNFNWNLPLVGLPGRAGMDLNLALSYNSLVWVKNGNSISFDDDHGFPGPGFRLGFPVIQPLSYNSEVGAYAYLLIGKDGSRTELRQVGTSTLFEAADSSHLLLDAATMVLRSTDGTQWKYELKGSEFQCTEIKDRNGNFLTINFTAVGRVDTIGDTLARSIKFNYDVTGYLTSITQVWNQGPNQVTHNWAVFEYTNTAIQTDFPGSVVLGPANGSTIKTLSKVTLADGSHYDFSYTSWGQVWKVSSFATDNHLLNYRSYKLPGSPLQTTGPQTDCPRFTERRDWAENWNENVSGVEQEAVTSYAPAVAATWTMPDNTSKSGMRAEVASADGTVNKIYFIGTAGTSSGWQRGLPALVETYSGGNWQRKVMTTWTQDSTSVLYTLNPRVTETNVYDPAGNRARVQTTYQQTTFANGTSCQLPRDVYEYAANATTILRSTRTDYHTSTVYSNRRIIGLVTEKRVYEGDVNDGGVLLSRLGLFYDNENGASSILNNDAPVQHDNSNYSGSFVTGRANVSSVRRYDVTNTAQFTTTSTKYNTAGAVVSSTDASGHVAQVSYTDAFSDNISRNTLAYPTTLIDPDSYSLTAKYNFDFGAVTSRRTPKPNTTTNLIEEGPEQIYSYDSIGRLERTASLVNNAYSRYIYGPNYVRTLSTVNTVADEAQSLQVFDGAGRTIAMARNHPGSAGGFRGQLIVYDSMGRAVKQSNPTETIINIPQPAVPLNPYAWPASGDDSAWYYTEQTYDWKGRQIRTTHPDAKYREASYSGCGCAGGEVMTLTDEGTIDGGIAKRRQQKIYSDVLGRTIRIELLSWQGGTPYSTTVNTYNARDEITQIRQYAGDENSVSFQDTTMAYDGYGRLQSRHIPEQNSGTSTLYTYNLDDTIHSLTDARGATATHSYNNRHLLTGISYSAPTGIAPTSNASFGYDGAGNRITMTDGLGEKTYNYDQLSRLISESRTFTGVGTFTLTYDYNLADQLKKITDGSNTTVNYSYDSAGQLTAVTGSDTLVAGISSYASDLQYRAWGDLKQISVGSFSTSISYNSRKQITNFNIAGVVNENYDYHSDGRLSFVHNTTDPNFDRELFYDQMGRLTLTGAGGEARHDSGPVPFLETINYGPFNDITQRETETWGGGSYFDAASYTNHRRSGWSYDASGRITNIDTRTYAYDAAGQNINVAGQRWTPNGYIQTSTESGFDGDGNRVRENSGSSGSMVLSYYLRSTVLDTVVEELNGNGQKQIGYVYTPSGMELATQVVGQNYVQWKQRSPLGTTQRGVFTTGSTSRFEFDPMRASVRTNPNSPPDHSGATGDLPGSGGSLDGRFSTVANPLSNCTRDGIYMPCELARRGEGTSADVIGIDPFVTEAYRGRRKKPVWVDQDTSYGVRTGDNELTVYSGPGGYFEWADDPDDVLELYTQSAGNPQNTGFSGSEQSTIEDALKLALAMTNAKEGKDQKKCDEAVKKLTNGRISSLNSLVSQYITSGAAQNILNGKNVPAGEFGTDNPGVPAFVLGTGSPNAKTYLNSKFFNFNGFGAAQAKAIVLLHEAVHQFGGMRDADLDSRQKKSQTVGSRNLTNAIVDNCYPVLRETFRSLQL